MIFIADVAGEYEALMRLNDRLPKDEEKLYLGDLLDRGKDSKRVIQHVIDDPMAVSLLANHEDMARDFLFNRKMYSPTNWIKCGGDKTLESYGYEAGMALEEIRGLFPKVHLDFLEGLPLYYEDEEVIATHAPLHSELRLSQAIQIHDSTYVDMSVIWNREPPRQRDKFQIFGHMSRWGLQIFRGSDQKPWGICLDQSRKNVLTAFRWPTGELYEEPY